MFAMYAIPILKRNWQECACDVTLTFKLNPLNLTIFDQVNRLKQKCFS